MRTMKQNGAYYNEHLTASPDTYYIVNSTMDPTFNPSYQNGFSPLHHEQSPVYLDGLYDHSDYYSSSPLTIATNLLSPRLNTLGNMTSPPYNIVSNGSMTSPYSMVNGHMTSPGSHLNFDVGSPRISSNRIPNTENVTKDYKDKEKSRGFIEFFGEEFEGMEETFRSALLQYFSQVDRERQDLSEELSRIRDDYQQYEEEGRHFKVDTAEKGRIIRKLTENGRLLVKEIERLKDEVKDGETLRQQLIMENNELQKQITHENIMLPQIENELKCLSDGGGYLQLLAEDTKKLTQQENEIRQYSNELYQQKKLCQQQATKLNKQTQALQNLSQINDELCLKLREMVGLQDVETVLTETQDRYKNLEREHLSIQNQCNELKQLVDSLENERNDAQKHVKCLEEKLTSAEEKENEKAQEIEALEKEIALLKHNMDEMVYEDDLRNDEFKDLQNHVEFLEDKSKETANREERLKKELEENESTIESLITKEECYKHKVKHLESKTEECKEAVTKMEIKLEHQLTREKQLEREVLSHVRENSKMEQEIALLKNNIEVLERENENWNAEKRTLESDLKSAKQTIIDFESKIIDEQPEKSMHRQLEDLEKKYNFSEEQRLNLQNEIFQLKDQLSKGEKNETIDHKKDELHYMNNRLNEQKSTESSIERNESRSVQLSSNTERLIYNAIENDESISCAELKIYVSKKEEECDTLRDEKNRYQDECTLLLDEIECLKENCQILENKLDERNRFIDELTKECSKLTDSIQYKNTLLEKQEDEIGILQEKIGITIDKEQQQNEIEEIQETLIEELSEKHRVIAELEIELTNLKHSLAEKEKELSEVKSERLNISVSESNIWLDKISTLEEDNLQKELKIRELEKHITRVKGNNQNLRNNEKQNTNDGNDVESDGNQEDDDEYITVSVKKVADEDDENIFVLQLQEITSENCRLHERLCELEDENQWLHKQQPGRIPEESSKLNYSFENEFVVSKQKYNDIIDSIENKEKIISDLQEHIDLLESDLISQRHSSTSILSKTREETVSASPRSLLRLPSPDTSPNNTFYSKRNSLPPLPGTTGNKISINQKRCESVESNMRDKRAETTIEDLRGKVIKLNAELLEKKLCVSKIEEELRVTRRRSARLEETHRQVVEKNEKLEEEILENRRKILEVQARQSGTVASEAKYKQEIQTYKENITNLKSLCKDLRDERDKSKQQLKENLTEQKMVENQLDQSDRQVKQWQHNNEMIEAECQSLTQKCERLQAEILKYREEAFELNRGRDMIQNERENWKRNIDLKAEQINELNAELDQRQEELREKVRANEKMYEQMKIIEHERDIFENKVKDDSHTMEKLRREISNQKEDNEILTSQLQEMRLKMESHSLENKDLMSEKEIASHNAKYLESKLDDLREQIKTKEQQVYGMKDENDLLAQQIRKTSEQLKYTAIDLENIKEQYSNETKNVSNLEKLNNDMNKENKRLMMEIVDIQKKFKKLLEDNNYLKGIISKLENEQSEVDNILVKSQASNSQLSEVNKNLKDDLTNSSNKISQLQSKIDETEKQKLLLENKLLNLEKEFDGEGRKSQKENEEMAREIHQSRALINEYQAVLDQGQLDFDEMDAQLERSRQENNELDQRLHDTLKAQIRMQSEREELDRKLKSMSEELQLVRNSLDNEKQFSDKMNRKNESLEECMNDLKANISSLDQRVKELDLDNRDKNEMIKRKEIEKEKFRQELIEAQRQVDDFRILTDDLSTQRESANQNESEQQHTITTLQNKETILREQIEQLNLQITTNTETLEEQAQYIKELKDERDNHETNSNQLLMQVHQLEGELEELQREYIREKTLLTNELSDLKVHATGQEKESEKILFDSKKMEYELAEALDNNEKLAEKLIEVLNETDLERETMIETIAQLEAKVNHYESDQWEELQDLRRTLEKYEEMKQKEFEDLQQNNESLLREDVSKTRQINSLREEKRRADINLENAQNENEKLSKTLSMLEDEKNQSKVRLLDDLTSKDNSIRVLEQRNNADNEQKNSLLTEIEKLQEANRKLFTDKLSERQDLENIIDDLRRKLMNYDILEKENENMKLDIESLLTNKHGYDSHFMEMSQLRSQVTTLQVKADRVDDVLNENRMLKQSLREVETTKTELINLRAKSERENLLTEENKALKEELDDLQVQNKSRQNVITLASSYGAAKSPRSDISASRANLDRIKQLTNENATLKQRIQDLERQLQQKQQQLYDQQYQNQQSQQHSSADSNRELISKMANETTSLRQENSSLKQQIRNLENQQKTPGSSSNESIVLNQMRNETRSLRSQVQDLQAKLKQAEEPMTGSKFNDHSNENRILKQELREIENKHIEEKDRLRQENTRLQRIIDDLFKKNQDFELRNTTAVRTKPKNVVFFEQALSSTAEPSRTDVNKNTSSMKQKAASFDSLSQASWGNFDFSPSKNPVASSTPTQDTKNGKFPSSMHNRSLEIIPQPSEENNDSLFDNQKQISSTNNPWQKQLQKQRQQKQQRQQQDINKQLNPSLDRPPSFRSAGPSTAPLIRQMTSHFLGGETSNANNPDKKSSARGEKKALIDRPDVSQISLEFLNQSTEQESEMNKPKADASWFDKKDDNEMLKRSNPIKNNPFFELDKSASQARWKKGAEAAVKSLSADSSPVKKHTQRKLQQIDFDMRPRSTEPPPKNRQQQQQQQKQRQVTQINNIPENQQASSNITDLSKNNEFVKRLKDMFEGSNK